MNLAREYNGGSWPAPRVKNATPTLVWVVTCIDCGRPTAVQLDSGHKRNDSNKCLLHPHGALTATRYVQHSALARMVLSL